MPFSHQHHHQPLRQRAPTGRPSLLSGPRAPMLPIAGKKDGGRVCDENTHVGVAPKSNFQSKLPALTKPQSKVNSLSSSCNAGARPVLGVKTNIPPRCGQGAFPKPGKVNLCSSIPGAQATHGQLQTQNTFGTRKPNSPSPLSRASDSNVSRPSTPVDQLEKHTFTGKPCLIPSKLAPPRAARYGKGGKENLEKQTYRNIAVENKLNDFRVQEAGSGLDSACGTAGTARPRSALDTTDSTSSALEAHARKGPIRKYYVPKGNKDSLPSQVLAHTPCASPAQKRSSTVGRSVWTMMDEMRLIHDGGCIPACRALVPSAQARVTALCLRRYNGCRRDYDSPRSPPPQEVAAATSTADEDTEEVHSCSTVSPAKEVVTKSPSTPATVRRVPVPRLDAEWLAALLSDEPEKGKSERKESLMRSMSVRLFGQMASKTGMRPESIRPEGAKKYVLSRARTLGRFLPGKTLTSKILGRGE